MNSPSDAVLCTLGHVWVPDILHRFWFNDDLCSFDGCRSVDWIPDSRRAGSCVGHADRELEYLRPHLGPSSDVL